MSQTAYIPLLLGMMAVFVAAIQPWVEPPTPYNEYMEKYSTYLEPGSAEARAYCPNPGGVFMRGSQPCVRIPTVEKPYCPTPGY